MHAFDIIRQVRLSALRKKGASAMCVEHILKADCAFSRTYLNLHLLPQISNIVALEMLTLIRLRKC